LIPFDAISASTLQKMKDSFRVFLEDVFGLTNINDQNNELLNPIMQLLLDIRKEAKSNKDFATSDKIRNQLTQLGILIKDDKEGNTTWGVA
jgi:cysteinyl-tRNA synthetase